MWWSCFSYYEKGPYHIQELETLDEKKACQADLATRNRERFEEDRLAQEAQNALYKLHATRSQTRPRAAFKHTKETRAFVLEEGKGGINQYQYQMKVLKPLLLPFAKKLLQKFEKVKVQEDNARPHASIYNQKVFQIEEIQRLLWPRNSPDLNAIEPTWFQIKREITKKEAITSNEQLKEAWIKCQNDMP